MVVETTREDDEHEGAVDTTIAGSSNDRRIVTRLSVVEAESEAGGTTAQCCVHIV